MVQRQVCWLSFPAAFQVDSATWGRGGGMPLVTVKSSRTPLHSHLDRALASISTFFVSKRVFAVKAIDSTATLSSTAPTTETIVFDPFYSTRRFRYQDVLEESLLAAEIFSYPPTRPLLHVHRWWYCQRKSLRFRCRRRHDGMTFFYLLLLLIFYVMPIVYYLLFGIIEIYLLIS